MNNNLAENLKKIRKDNNLSQEQLAEILGVSRQAISKWEQSIAYPEMDKIITICNKFNLNIDDLLNKDIREIKKEEEAKRSINKYIDDFLNFITDTINLFSNMTFKSKIKCLLEQLIIIAALFIISTIFMNVIGSLILNIINILPEQIRYFLDSIIESILILFCIISSIIILTHIFKTRYLDYYKKEKNTNNENINNDNNQNDKTSLKSNENRIIIRDPKHSEYRFINALFKLIIGVIKFLSLWFSLFLCFTLICIFIALILSFLTFKTGLFFIGLITTILAAGSINIIFLLLIFNFVFNRKNNKKKMIWTFIISLVICGLGIGSMLIGTLDFEILDNDESLLQKETIELEMKDNTFFHNYGDIEYIEKDINNIEVEYNVYKYCKANYTENGDNSISIWGYCPQPTKIVKEFIDNVNDKKIILINSNIEGIKIYASKDNIEKLKNNKTNIEKNNNYINNLEKEIYEKEQKIKELEEKLDNYNDNE